MMPRTQRWGEANSIEGLRCCQRPARLLRGASWAGLPGAVMDGAHMLPVSRACLLWQALLACRWPHSAAACSGPWTLQAAGGVEMDVAADGSKVKVRPPPPPHDLPCIAAHTAATECGEVACLKALLPAPVWRLCPPSPGAAARRPPMPAAGRQLVARHRLPQVLVIPTDEELSIAQQTLDVIRQSKGVAAAA